MIYDYNIMNKNIGSEKTSQSRKEVAVQINSSVVGVDNITIVTDFCRVSS